MLKYYERTRKSSKDKVIKEHYAKTRSVVGLFFLNVGPSSFFSRNNAALKHIRILAVMETMFSFSNSATIFARSFTRVGPFQAISKGLCKEFTPHNA